MATIGIIIVAAVIVLLVLLSLRTVQQGYMAVTTVLCVLIVAGILVDDSLWTGGLGWRIGGAIGLRLDEGRGGLCAVVAAERERHAGDGSADQGREGIRDRGAGRRKRC